MSASSFPVWSSSLAKAVPSSCCLWQPAVMVGRKNFALGPGNRDFQRPSKSRPKAQDQINWPPTCTKLTGNFFRSQLLPQAKGTVYKLRLIIFFKFSHVRSSSKKRNLWMTPIPPMTEKENKLWAKWRVTPAKSSPFWKWSYFSTCTVSSEIHFMAHSVQ